VQKQITTLFHPHTKFPNARIHGFMHWTLHMKILRARVHVTAPLV